ncbi:MAG: winged helix-turn-helix domain-containing protein [Thermodesulfobacteriota bacterium]
MAEDTKKEALKGLRQARKETIDSVRERVKKNREIRKTLSEALSDGPKTVPELAQATGIPSQYVLWHLTSMKKYGKVAEGDPSGDYFQYVLLKE